MPLRWQSDKWTSWFFEEQSNRLTWKEFIDNQFTEEFSNISKSLDANGYPVVVMQKKNGNLVRLTQYMSYFKNRDSILDEEIVSGYWVKKKSNNFY